MKPGQGVWTLFFKAVRVQKCADTKVSFLYDLLISSSFPLLWSTAEDYHYYSNGK